MRRVSLALSLSVAAVCGVLLGAQDPEHAPPPRGATQTPAAAPAVPANAPAQPPAAAVAMPRRQLEDAAGGAASTRLPSPAPNRCSNPSAASAMATTRAGGPADLIWPGRWSSSPIPGGKELAGFLRTGRPERGMPAFPGLTDQEIADIAEFLHERLEAARSRAATDTMASLVGDAKAGAAYFNGPGRCTTCHSVTGDLAGIGAKYDPPTLQGRIVNPRPGGGRGQAAVSPRATRTVAVTLSNGQTVSGALDFISEFAVTLIEPSGARRSFTREGDVPKVVVTDPLQAHFDMLRTFRDKDMQDLTAYLWTLK